MDNKDFIIAGLGNPGSGYADTRHNVGFMLVDRLAREHGLSFSASRWDTLMVRSQLWGRRVCLLKPQTYMNRSGRAVAGVARFYNIEPQSILAVHDDLDMRPGRIKLVCGGGAGGHNGIRSLTEHLGSADFFRLKIGIGRPGSEGVHADIPVDRYVLSVFSIEEAALINERMALLEDGISALVLGDAGRAKNLLNSLK